MEIKAIAHELRYLARELRRLADVIDNLARLAGLVDNAPPEEPTFTDLEPDHG